MVTHAELVVLAGKWLKARGCAVVMVEMVCGRETADAIGFKNQQSYLVECKTSHADFLADAKKCHRRIPEHGMGNYRFYMCEEGVIPEDELPLGWGLLYTDGKKAKQIRGMKGNCGATEMGVFHFPAFLRAERTLLLSALRRMTLTGRER